MDGMFGSSYNFEDYMNADLIPEDRVIFNERSDDGMTVNPENISLHGGPLTSYSDEVVHTNAYDAFQLLFDYVDGRYWCIRCKRHYKSESTAFAHVRNYHVQSVAVCKESHCHCVTNTVQSRREHIRKHALIREVARCDSDLENSPEKRPRVMEQSPNSGDKEKGIPSYLLYAKPPIDGTTVEMTDKGGRKVAAYKCDLCASSYIHSYHAKKHVETHRGEWLTCWYCPLMVNGKMKLREHYLRHHPEMCVRMLCCSGCNKRYTKEENYKKHVALANPGSTCNELNKYIILTFSVRHNVESDDDIANPNFHRRLYNKKKREYETLVLTPRGSLIKEADMNKRDQSGLPDILSKNTFTFGRRPAVDWKRLLCNEYQSEEQKKPEVNVMKTINEVPVVGREEVVSAVSQEMTNDPKAMDLIPQFNPNWWEDIDCQPFIETKSVNDHNRNNAQQPVQFQQCHNPHMTYSEGLDVLNSLSPVSMPSGPTSTGSSSDTPQDFIEDILDFHVPRTEGTEMNQAYKTNGLFQPSFYPVTPNFSI